LPRLGAADGANEEQDEKSNEIHVDMTKNFIVVMRRNGKILKIPSAQILEVYNKMVVLEWTTVDLPIAYF
jgi:hypothetical protein